MASAAEGVEIWSVVIISPEEDKCKVYNLPCTSTVATVRHKWESNFNLQGQSLLTYGARRLSDHDELRQVGEAAPGFKMVKFHVEEAVTLSITVSNRGENWNVNAFLSQYPLDLHPVIQKTLKLQDGQYFRLQTSSGPVSYNQTLEQQGISTDVCLLVDVAFEIEVVDRWEKTKGRWFMYASERFRDVLSEETNDGDQLLFGGRSVDANDRLSDVLTLRSLNETNLTVGHRKQREIVTVIAGSARQHRVWPEDSCQKFIPKLSSRLSPLTIEKEIVPIQGSVRTLGVPQHGLVSSIVCATVQLSKNRYAVVRVPETSAVSEVATAITGRPADDEIYLADGKRQVKSQELVRNLGKDACLDLKPETMTFVVKLQDRSVRWRTRIRPMKHTEFMYELTEKSSLDFRDLVGKSLMCDGCGRKIVKEEEEYQVIPERCCRVKSLRLRELFPNSKDAGTQTRICRRAESTVDTASQAIPTCPLVIFDYFQVDSSYKSKSNKSVDLRWKKDAKIGDLRRALAEHFDMDPSILHLSQHVGFCKFEEMVGASALDHSGWWGYYDAIGRLHEPEDIYQWTWKPLDDDKDPFNLDSTVRSHVAVSIAPLRQFVIINDLTNLPEERYIHTDLPLDNGATVRDLKAVLASLLDMAVENMYLSRRVSRSAVATHVGMFSDPRPSLPGFDSRLENGDSVEGIFPTCWEPFVDDSIRFPCDRVSHVRVSSTPIRLFVVHNDFKNDSGHMFIVDLPLHYILFEDNLRSALATHMNHTPDQLWLSRPVGEWRGTQTVFGVYSSDRDGEWGFCSAAGVECKQSEVTRWRWEKLDEVEVPFRFLPGWINAVRISPAPLSAFHIFFYGATRGMKELNVQLPLPGKPTVGVVREAVAHYLVAPTDLKLSRRVGRRQGFFRGIEVFGVFDEQQPGREAFCDIEGNDVSEVKQYEWKYLERDSAPFLLFPGKRHVILVDTNAN